MANDIETRPYSNRAKMPIIDAERVRIGVGVGAIFSGVAVVVGAATIWAGDRGMLASSAEDIREIKPRVHAIELQQAEQRQINAALLDAVRNTNRTLERLDAKIDAQREPR
jgi:hypothetical protein